MRRGIQDLNDPSVVVEAFTAALGQAYAAVAVTAGRLVA
jgi:hypothetical protein